MKHQTLLTVSFAACMCFCHFLEGATVNEMIFRRVNPDETSGFFQGDIIQSNKQRMTSNNASLKWPTTSIAYTVDPSYDEESLAVIKGAMNEIQRNTCLTFVQLNPNSTDQWPKDYLMFQNLVGCASSVGRQGGPQTISIQIPNCAFRGIVMHEILHSLGLLHEHNRPDRDKFIKINWTNVEAEMMDHLQPYDEDSVYLFDEDYDYSSILHGSSAIFAIDPNYSTLIPFPDDTVVIGQRSSLSDSDIRRLKAFYCSTSEAATTTNRPETTTANIVCNATTQYIPHPTDCSKFYACTNLFPQLQSCPPNLLFNPSLNVCDWSWNVNCTTV